VFELEWTPTDGSPTQTIDFDVADTERYELAIEITDHPVESGSAITDNARPQNGSFTITGWATNTPIVSRNFGTDGAVVSTQTVRLPGGASVQVVQASQAFNRATAIDQAIQRLARAGQLFTVRTSLRTISNVLIANYAVERDKSTGNALEVTLQGREIRIASTTRVTATRTAQRRGQQARNRGSQPSAPASAPANSSLLSNLLGH